MFDQIFSHNQESRCHVGRIIPVRRSPATMADTHSSRIFRSGNATTLYVTIPAEVVSDSQLPLDAAQEVTVTIDEDQLTVSKSNEETDT